MANIFDVAKYIAESCPDEKIAKGKLNYICYFMQANFLVCFHEPLFKEDFYAAAGGPICKPLVSRLTGKHYVAPEDVPGNSDLLSEQQKKNIDLFLREYINKDSVELYLMAKGDDAYLAAKYRDETEPIIKKADIFDFYLKLYLQTKEFGDYYIDRPAYEYSLNYHIILRPVNKDMKQQEMSSKFRTVMNNIKKKEISDIDHARILHFKTSFVENKCIHVFASASPVVSPKEIVDTILGEFQESFPDVLFEKKFLIETIGDLDGKEILDFTKSTPKE